jgi:hypothetical protein
MTVPPGWVTSTSTQPLELILAATQADLTADAPSNARVTAMPSPATVPSAATILAGLKPSPFVGQVNSQQGTLAGHPEVSVQFNQTSAAGVVETTKTIVASLPGGRAYIFTLEAPQASWDNFQLSFATALSDLSFDLSAIPTPS